MKINSSLLDIMPKPAGGTNVPPGSDRDDRGDVPADLPAPRPFVLESFKEVVEGRARFLDNPRFPERLLLPSPHRSVRRKFCLNFIPLRRFDPPSR